MISLQGLVRIDRTSGTPIYLQVASSLIFRVLRGQLPRGAKLPGTAKLAKVLGTNRKTLQAAFDELMAQGWVQISPRRGAFIVDKLPDIESAKLSFDRKPAGFPKKAAFPIRTGKLIQFPQVVPSDRSRKLVLDGGLPDVRLAPLAELAREYRSLSRRTTFATYLGYGHPMGSQYLLETLAEFLRDTRGLAVSPESACA